MSFLREDFWVPLPPLLKTGASSPKKTHSLLVVSFLRESLPFGLVLPLVFLVVLQKKEIQLVFSLVRESLAVWFSLLAGGGGGREGPKTPTTSDDFFAFSPAPRGWAPACPGPARRFARRVALGAWRWTLRPGVGAE